jgi:hypothetical protein
MDDLAREALRIYRRYQIEIVEELKLCPWAERARVEGRVEERVLLMAEPDAETVLREIDALARDPRVEIGLLIFPCLSISRAGFERFVAGVVQTDTEQREVGTVPFAMAAFHPDAAPDMGSAERLVPFLRRTPDPTIQLVRCSSLDRVREGSNEGTQFMDVRALATLDFTEKQQAPLRERIAKANLRTVERLGVDEVERRLEAIVADRDASYARWGSARAARARQP